MAKKQPDAAAVLRMFADELGMRSFREGYSTVVDWVQECAHRTADKLTPKPKPPKTYSLHTKLLAKRTRDAFSAKRYASWSAVADAVLARGYTLPAAEEILRSKITRWAADQAVGRPTAKDLLRYLDAHPRDIAHVLREAGLVP